MKIYDIIPCPKPRMTSADKWKKRPETQRYWAFCDEVRLKKVAFENACHVIFVLPMPESWSKKKRLEMDGQPHQSKPDSDNLIKALGDALYSDDSHLWHYAVTKIWGVEGQIRIVKI
jgi:Holliday junction resolvase RusA-like endonuclease